MMRWRLRKRIGPLEGELARKRAEEELTKTMAETPKYLEIAQANRRQIEMNSLSKLFYDIHRGRA